MRTIPCKNTLRNSHEQGLYRRYEVKKVEGEQEPGAMYFVLRLDAGGGDVAHIEACQAAALEYARWTTNRQLANDIIRLVAEQSGIMATKAVMKEIEKAATD